MEATVNSKADTWRRHIDDQRASGQSVRAWCKVNDAQECSFYWWRAKLGLSPGKRRLRRPLRSAEAKPTPLAFAQVVVHPPTAEPLRLRFAGGHELILPASMPIEQVARLVYDALGRLVDDCVTSIGSNVDPNVRRISRTYEVRGMLTGITSYNSPTVGSGSVVNDDQLLYNAFGQLASDQQSHSGAVNTSTSPITQYAYDNGSTNEIRPVSVTYPNSRVVYYNYNDAGDTAGISAAINRITAISTHSTRGTSDGFVIASYNYVGLNHVLQESYPKPKVRLDYWGGTGTGTTGDFVGWDNFDRIASQDWVNYNDTYSTTTFDVFKINHGYDQDSNRTYADNQVQLGSSKLYTYDSLNRLTDSQDGILNTTMSAVAPGSFPSGIGYALDTLGNQTGHSVPESSSADSSTFDKANKLTTRSVKGNIRSTSFTDNFDESLSATSWTKIGADDNCTTGSSGLTVTGLTTYNPGDPTNQENRFILLLPQNSGPFTGSMTWNIPTDAASGQFGYVFGYKSINDYWLAVNDIADSNEYLYHVSDGIKTLCAENDGWGALGFSSDNNNWWDGGSYYFDEGFPSGRIGLFTTIPNTNFTSVSFWPNSSKRDLAGRWDNFKTDVATDSGPSINAVNPSTSMLQLDTDSRPVLLKSLRLNKFQVTFSFSGSNMAFLFGADNDSSYNAINLTMDYDPPTATNKEGDASDYTGGTSLPTLGDVMWVRIASDGTNVTVNRIGTDTTAPSEDEWTACTDSITFTGLDMGGGLMGFELGPRMDLPDTLYGGPAIVGNVSVNSGVSPDWFNEDVEDFAVDSSGSATSNITLSSDANGNQTYDGVQAYTYDAWNRLMTVSHGYGTGSYQRGQIAVTMGYDGRGRRISKTVGGTENWDCTYNYYLDGDSVIEERNGSNETIKQFTWGKRYIDELVQMSINSAPTSQSTCDVPYWVCQDANWNVLGVVDADGVLRERYEYTPYGERSVFTSYGTNDPYCMEPTLASQRVVTSDSAIQPYGLCEVGHQGLFHDEESGLVHERSRDLNVALGRFNQRETFGAFYIDGLNLYQGLDGNPVDLIDPFGLSTWDTTKKAVKCVCRIAASTASGAAAGAAAGAGTGAAIGGIAGAVGGAGVGAAPGAGAGALAGGATGGIAGGISGLVSGLVKEYNGNPTIGQQLKGGAISGGISGATGGVLPGLGAGAGVEIGVGAGTAGAGAGIGAGTAAMVNGAAGAVGGAVAAGANGGGPAQVAGGAVVGGLVGGIGGAAGAGDASAKIAGGISGVDGELCGSAVGQTNNKK